MRNPSHSALDDLHSTILIKRLIVIVCYCKRKTIPVPYRCSYFLQFQQLGPNVMPYFSALIHLAFLDRTRTSHH